MSAPQEIDHPAKARRGFMSKIDSSTFVPVSAVGLLLLTIASFAADRIVSSLNDQSAAMKAQSDLIQAQSKAMSELSHRIDLMELKMSSRMEAIEDVVQRKELRAWIRELKAVNLSKIEVPPFDQ